MFFSDTHPCGIPHGRTGQPCKGNAAHPGCQKSTSAPNCIFLQPLGNDLPCNRPVSGEESPIRTFRRVGGSDRAAIDRRSGRSHRCGLYTSRERRAACRHRIGLPLCCNGHPAVLQAVLRQNFLQCPAPGAGRQKERILDAGRLWTDGRPGHHTTRASSFRGSHCSCGKSMSCIWNLLAWTTSVVEQIKDSFISPQRVRWLKICRETEALAAHQPMKEHVSSHKIVPCCFAVSPWFDRTSPGDGHHSWLVACPSLIGRPD